MTTKLAKVGFGFPRPPSTVHHPHSPQDRSSRKSTLSNPIFVPHPRFHASAIQRHRPCHLLHAGTKSRAHLVQPPTTPCCAVVPLCFLAPAGSSAGRRTTASPVTRNRCLVCFLYPTDRPPPTGPTDSTGLCRTTSPARHLPLQSVEIGHRRLAEYRGSFDGRPDCILCRDGQHAGPWSRRETTIPTTTVCRLDIRPIDSRLPAPAGKGRQEFEKRRYQAPSLSLPLGSADRGPLLLQTKGKLNPEQRAS